MEAILGLIALFAVLYFLVWLLNLICDLIFDRVNRRRSEELVSAYLSGRPNARKAVALYKTVGMLGIDTQAHELTLSTKKHGNKTFHASKIVGVGQSHDVETTLSTRGRTVGTRVAGLAVSAGRAETTVHTHTSGSYVVLSLDDYESPSVTLPMRTTREAEHWAGMVRVMVGRLESR